jgi:Zn-finger protein
MTAPDSQDGYIDPEDVSPPDRRLGPHYVPTIPCGKCGTEHHIDATTGEYIGRCVDCSAFLRRPNEAEEQQFIDFLDWNTRHADRDREVVA